MIRLEVDDKALDLNKGKMTITFKWPNSFLTDIKITAPHSLPIELPDTNKNKMVLGYLNEPLLDGSTQVFDCKLWVNGALTLFSKLIIKGYQGKFRGHISANTLGVGFLDKLLKDFDWPNSIDMGTTSLDVVSFCQGDHRAKGFSFPAMYNKSFYGEKNKHFKELNPKGNAVSLVNPPGENKYAFVAMPYLVYVLNQCFKQEGWELKGNFLKDEFFKDLLMYNNKALDEEQEVKYLTSGLIDYRHSDYNTDKWTYGKYIEPSRGRIPFIAKKPHNVNPHNLWDSSAFEYTIPAAGEYEMYVECGFVGGYEGHNFRQTMNLYVDGVIKETNGGPFAIGTRRAFSTIDYAPTFTSADIGKKVHFEFFVEYQQNKEGDWKTGAGWWLIGHFRIARKLPAYGTNVYKKTLDYSADVMPPFTLRQVLKGAREWGNLHFNIDYQDKVIEINSIEHLLLRNRVIDITNRVRSEPVLSFKRKNGLRIEWKEPELAGDFKQIDGGELKITPFFTRIVKAAQEYRGKEKPTVDEKGTTAVYDETNKPKPRLFHENSLYDSTALNPKYGAQGIYERYYENSIKLSTNGEIWTWETDFSLHEAENLTKTARYLIRNKLYFLLEASARVDSSGLEKVNITTVKIPYE